MQNYIDLVRQVWISGEPKQNRTGILVRSLFGTRLQFHLTTQFPLLTSRKMFFRGIVEELLFFVRGETDTKKLEEKGITIWKGNTSREFLDSRGLEVYPEGEMGPGYGFQWRNFNGDCEEHSSKGIRTGIDQLKDAIELLRKDPTSRRVVVSAWNPMQLEEMALPPCHIMYQFNVTHDRSMLKPRLDCQFYMRSVDLILGLPFNIASYALLTMMVAKILGCVAGRLIFVGGDSHIYETHETGVQEQLGRVETAGPYVKILKDIRSIEDMEALQFEDFELVNYKAQPPIKFEMVV
jgi:thymidylate synthase